MNPTPRFHVGDVPIYGDVILAPMAGFADVPHRALCRSFGSAMNYTEFLATDDVINGRKQALSSLDFTPDDEPMVFQLFGNNSASFLEAALRIESHGPDIIDINMGCSTRRVSGRGAGVGMMPQLEMIEETFNLLSKHLTVPVTGKIRLGWENLKNFHEVARVMEDNGASSIAIHPRTKEQKYNGRAEWDAIAQLVHTVKIPVIGSGDVGRPEDIDRMRRQTGCQAVMIGRGAIGNPWLFARLDKDTLPICEITSTVRRHLASMIDYYGPRGLILFRKYVKRYLDDDAGIVDYRRQMLKTEDPAEFLDLLEKAEAALQVRQLTY